MPLPNYLIVALGLLVGIPVSIGVSYYVLGYVDMGVAVFAITLAVGYVTIAICIWLTQRRKQHATATQTAQEDEKASA